MPSRIKYLVSIQLIAPASGAVMSGAFWILDLECFHSTDCPSEWGPQSKRDYPDMAQAVSSQLIAPASGAWNANAMTTEAKCFLSTDCPSEWGRNYKTVGSPVVFEVSIQLIAPASGAKQ